MKYKQINKQNIWVEKLSKKNFEDSPCLFLDRDGVLIDWKDYTMKVKDLKLTIGCDKIIKKCNKKKITVVLITNQGGIGLGIHTWNDFIKVQKVIIKKQKLKLQSLKLFGENVLQFSTQLEVLSQHS